MKYRVIVTPEAEADLRIAYGYIRRDSPDAARAWIKAVRTKIASLATHPERARFAPESTSFSQPIRELLHGGGNRGTYRILFVILDHSVFVLKVRHGSMLAWEPER